MNQLLGMCEHGCGHEARYQHADGRELCTPCYLNETGCDEPIVCPTCSPSTASTTQPEVAPASKSPSFPPSSYPEEGNEAADAAAKKEQS